MGLTLKPLIKCNMRCPGCYENAIPSLWSGGKGYYDLDKIKAGILAFVENWRRRWPRETPYVTFHGGEVTLMKIDDLEELFELCRRQGAGISMQTNGSLLTDRLLLAFRHWDVGVGVSVDGPWPLGRSRLLVANPHQDPKLDEMNARNVQRVMDNLVRLRRYGVRTSIICVLTKANSGDAERRQRMKAWLLWLKSIGICEGRMNPFYDDDPVVKADLELTYEQWTEAFNDYMDFVLSDPELHWDSFREMTDNLLGLGINPCWFNSCDVYNTAAVQALFGDGSPGNCLRTSQDGVPYLRDDSQFSDARQQILLQTPQEFGGCQGCEFWRVCHGGCPAEALEGDWRNRSRFCPKPNYAHLRQKLRGLLPNVLTVDTWQTNDERGLEEARIHRRADINAFRLMDPGWSQAASSYRWTACQKRESGCSS